MQAFVSELRRRNVLRVAAFYAAAAWLLVQVATQVFPFFDIPNWTVRLVVVASILGFPAALALAWFYELTPQGLKLESEVQADASITRSTGRKLDRWIIAVLALAVILLLADKLVLKQAVPVEGATDKSIAVLPFENLSEDKANAFFADGIQDEILTRLAKVGALKVISRTSTQQYASRPGNLTQIAHELGVANILEGSVQKIGDAVHINVQLIRAAGDEHLWAESYNRKLDDVFGVEGEVAQTVAEALKAQLSGAEHMAMMAKPTDNAAAYEAYTRGRALEMGSYDQPDLERALQDYAEATRLDPRFALAWAHAAVVGSLLYFNGSRTPQATAEAILHAADTALGLQPELGEAWLARGYYRYRVLRDFAGAEQAFETARQHLPNDPQVFTALEAVQRRLGKWNEAVANLQRVLELDPRNVFELVDGALELMGYLGRFDEARHILDQAQAVSPGGIWIIGPRMQIETEAGRIDEADAWAARLPPVSSRGADWSDEPLVTLRLYQRKYDQVIALVQAKLPPANQPVPLDDSMQLVFLMARAQELSGRKAEAAASYRRLLNSIKPSADTVVRVDEARAPQMLAAAYAGLGDRKAALDATRQALEDYRDDGVASPEMEAMQAYIQARFDDTESAMGILAKLAGAPAGLFAGNLKFNPDWDALRGDPRFQKLIADTEATAAAKTSP